MAQPKIISMTITLGEEVFQPYQYESFRCGPISATFELNEGESPHEAIKAVKEMLRPAWDELFLFARNSFYEHHSAKG